MSSGEAATLRGQMDAHMQPDVVARTLKNVEKKWAEEAAEFIHCNATSKDAMTECQDMPSEFSKSCAVVVGAVVQGSSGDKRVASEYMSNICGQSLMDGWHQQHCLGLKVALDAAMTADSYQNRNAFTAKKLCSNFWSEFVQEEQKRFIKEEAERKEAEKKAAEEAEKRQKEAAEKAKKAKEEEERLQKQAKELEEKKAAAEAARKKIEDAKRMKEEAQAKAAKAAEALAKKRAEAEEMAKKAQQKMEEAAAAEREHKNAIANLTSNENSTESKELAGTVDTSKNSTQEQEHDSPKAEVLKLKAASPIEVLKATSQRPDESLVKNLAQPEKLMTIASSNSSAPVAVNGTSQGHGSKQ